MKSIVTAAFLSLHCLSALSQITLEQSEYKKLLDSGYDIYHWVEEDDVRFDIGTPGTTDNVYDLTAFKFVSEPVEQRFRDPKGMRYAEKFPEATHCQKWWENCHYYQLTPDRFNNLMDFLILGSEDVYLKYVPPRPELKFPLTMGASWEYESEKLRVDSTVEAEMKYRSQYKVVAAGTLITPAGKRQCLVLKDVHSYDFITLDGTESTRGVVYRLIDAQGLEAVIGIVEEDAETTTPRITSLHYTALPAQKYEEI